MEDRERLRLGARLRTLRERAGLSQAELAARAGVTGPTISNYETGYSGMSSARLSQIARALRIAPTALFEEDRVAEAPPYWQLHGWDQMRKEDRRLYEEIVEAFDRWRDATLHRRQMA